ncbi:M48 family metallopeptidase [Halocatena halophila]|uniref:M48 family metallopeptidase n=1 Tax=Halocatena halophila TaxID=2814576 RepID=UPI002ED0B7E5
MAVRIAVALSIGTAVLATSILALGATAAVFVGSVLLVGLNILDYETSVLPDSALLLVLAAGGCLGLIYGIYRVALSIRRERKALVPTEEPTSNRGGEVSDRIVRLSQQLDISTPAVRLLDTAYPVSYTSYSPDAPLIPSTDANPTIVVSSGLYELLTPAELDAVLAHELAHIANDDLRLITMIRLPLLFAESLSSEVGYPTNITEILGVALTTVATRGVGIVARARELAADRGAVALTGDPNALVSALEALEKHDEGEPDDVLEEFTHSASSIAIYPVFGNRRWPSTPRHHPSLSQRTNNLKSK